MNPVKEDDASQKRSGTAAVAASATRSGPRRTATPNVQILRPTPVVRKKEGTARKPNKRNKTVAT